MAHVHLLPLMSTSAVLNVLTSPTVSAGGVLKGLKTTIGKFGGKEQDTGLPPLAQTGLSLSSEGWAPGVSGKEHLRDWTAGRGPSLCQRNEVSVEHVLSAPQDLAFQGTVSVCSLHAWRLPIFSSSVNQIYPQHPHQTHAQSGEKCQKQE